VGLRVSSLVVFALGWELLARRLDSLLLPGFTETIVALARLLTTGLLWQAVWLSNQAMVLGFLLAATVGILLGLLMGRWRAAERYLDPYLNILLVTSKSALIPIVIMASGLGLLSRVLVVFISAVVVITVNVRAGLRMIDPAWVDLGAACAELWFARHSLRLRLWQKVAVPQKQFLHYSLPLSLDTGARRLHKRVDLWAVQALAGATAAGHYSVARSFHSTASIFSQALYPVILATVSGAWAQGHRDAARGIIRQSLRLTLWLLPFAALGAGTAPALITLIFGDAYLPAASLLAWVSFSIVALVIISVTTVIFAAVGRPGSAFAFNGPLLLLALAGYLVLVPRVGAVGAAATTTVTTWAVAVATMVGVYLWCQVSPGRGTVARIMVTSAIAYALARAWHAPGGWVIPQLLALCGVVLLLLFVLGELTAQDIGFALSLLKQG
jgi:O-antigen/teichoic acid export membrane protein